MFVFRDPNLWTVKCKVCVFTHDTSRYQQYQKMYIYIVTHAHTELLPLYL